jgi:hypothetical protein
MLTNFVFVGMIIGSRSLSCEAGVKVRAGALLAWSSSNCA